MIDEKRKKESGSFPVSLTNYPREGLQECEMSAVVHWKTRQHRKGSKKFEDFFDRRYSQGDFIECGEVIEYELKKSGRPNSALSVKGTFRNGGVNVYHGIKSMNYRTLEAFCTMISNHECIRDFFIVKPFLTMAEWNGIDAMKRKMADITDKMPNMENEFLMALLCRCYNFNSSNNFSFSSEIMRDSRFELERRLKEKLNMLSKMEKEMKMKEAVQDE